MILSHNPSFAKNTREKKGNKLDEKEGLRVWKITLLLGNGAFENECSHYPSGLLNS